MPVEARTFTAARTVTVGCSPRDPATGEVFIRHERYEPLGVQPTHIDIGAFLSSGPRNPEHQALLHMIATLIKPPR
jgi:hypothetical protein